jgi:hypothetical protein
MTSPVTRDAIATASPVTPTIKQPQPATAAQRQRAYRMRRKRAFTQAIGEEDGASRVTLIALLANELALLDAETCESTQSALRNSARRALRALVTRYEIDLGDDA